MPDVSIILAVLNGAQTIRKAIESAQAQTIRDLEIVVINDGSTDGTYDLVMAMAAHDSRIRCKRLPENIGVGGARNAALAMATGTWVAVLDADDWYEPNRLEILLKAAQELRADLVADNLKIYDHIRHEIVDQTRHGQGRIVDLTAEMFFRGDNPLRRHPTGFLQPLMRRQFLVDHKIIYDQTHRVGEDFLLVAEILLQGARAFIVPEACYIYVHRISPTTRKISPHSHSDVRAVFELFVRGCDQLLQKYGSSMTSATRRALEQRRRSLQNAAKYKEMRAALHEGKFFEAIRIVIARPVILVLIANIVINLLRANARFYLRLQPHRR